MTRPTLLAISFSLALALASCTTMQGDMEEADANDVESTLRSAGFRLIPSDTPQRIESMRTLPPLAFSQVTRDGRPYFVYADPRSCMCLWVGSLAQMQRYAQLASEEQVNAIQGEFEDVELQAELWDPDWTSIDY